MMRWLGVRAEEKSLVAGLTGLFAVVQASHGLGANTADALFFLRFGVDSLPLMIFLAGPAVMLFILAHGSGVAARGTAGWLPVATSLAAGWTVLQWSLALSGLRLAYPVIWISTQVIIMVTYTVMWNAAGASCTTRQAKRLFPLFATAGIGGGVMGNLLTGPLAHLLGTQHLLLVQGALLLAATYILRGATARFADEGPDAASSPLAGLGSVFSAVVGNRFTTIAALIAVTLATLFYLVYFPFSAAVAASFPTEAEVAAFLGLFSSVATAVTFLVSLLITNRLFARFGLVISLMIVPAIYAGGFGLWLGGLSLGTATGVRGLQWVSVNAIEGTAFTALFNVMTGRRRSQIVAFMTAVPTQVGTAAAGLLLMATGNASPATIFIIGLGLATVCLLLVFRLRPEYLEAVMSAVRRGVVGVLDQPAEALFIPEDADARRVLEDMLTDHRPEARAVAAAALARVGDVGAAPRVELLLSDPNPKVRAAAFASICVLEPQRVASYAEAALHDESPRVRLQVVRYLGGAAPEASASLLEPVLEDPDPVVRAAAATAIGGPRGELTISRLLDEDEPVAIAAGLAEIATRSAPPPAVDAARFLDHPLAGIRRWAVLALARSDAEASILLPYLEDRSPQVRRAAAEGLAESETGRAALVEVLSTGSVIATEAALRALVPMDQLPGDFVSWAVTEAERAAHLEKAAEALDNGEGSLAQRYLVRLLRMRVERLVEWVLLAMTTERTKAMMPTVALGVRSSDEETRAQAIEAVETLGVREVSLVLLPLLEPGAPDPNRERASALEVLADDFDPWISGLARRVRANAGGSDDVPTLSSMQPDEAPETLGPIERILALQRVNMFSDLDPEDLERLGTATREIRYPPGEPIFLEGRSGDEMILIVAGEVEVSTLRDSVRMSIETYGPGEPVGELALLGGGIRSADVHAGDTGAHCLLLSGPDLVSVLEDRPEVALRMLATLATRLARQTSEGWQGASPM